MKTYLKNEYDVDEIVIELGELKDVQVVEKGNLYMIYYDPSNEMDREVVRINKDDKRIIFSATSSLFKNKMKDKYIEM